MRQISRKALLRLTWVLLSAPSAAVLLGTQRQGETDIKQRFTDWAELAARFTETYTRDLLEQERRIAPRELGRSSVSPKDFAGVQSLFGYETAVLLDARGRALQLAPARASVIGLDLTKEYAPACRGGGTHSRLERGSVGGEGHPDRGLCDAVRLRARTASLQRGVRCRADADRRLSAQREPVQERTRLPCSIRLG